MNWKKIKTTGVLLLAASTLLAGIPAKGAEQNPQEELEAAENSKSQAEEKLGAVNEKIDELNEAKAELEDNVEELDSQLGDLSSKMEELNQKLTSLEKKIKKNKQKLKQARKDEKTQYEAMKKRIRYLYESGDYTYLDSLFSSQNITEFLSSAEYINQISSYDREMLKKYEQTKNDIDQNKKELEERYTETKKLQDDIAEQETQIQGVLDDKKNQIETYLGEIGENEELAAVYQDEVEAQNSVLAEIQAQAAAIAAAEEASRQAAAQAEAERAAQAQAAAAQAEAEAQAAAQAAAEAAALAQSEAQAAQDQEDQAAADAAQSEADAAQAAADAAQSEADAAQSEAQVPQPETEASAGVGGFVWPCPSSYTISSDFGGRESPTAGASSNHMGIDIAAGTGTPIVAAASGTVIISQYSPSAGNYVTISHGNGLCTVYMHASALYVSAGQRVSAGETIAAVGSTGYSTGPHLHFGVTLNGSYVNPHSYVG